VSFDRPSVLLAFAVAVAAALSLAACGRAGPLEQPPGPAAGVPSAQLVPSDATPAPGSPQEAVKNGFDAHGNPVAAPGQKKAFVLDPLLQ
jgi:predicted small lipoprotein YifL